MSGQKLTEKQISWVLFELERWADGELGSKLTWLALERIAGFSRQALAAHPEIQSAYKKAKLALRSGSIKASRSQTNEQMRTLERKIASLEAIVADYKKREEQWQMRWQRIAYNLQQKGFSVSEVDGPDKVPTQRETAKVLSLFDKPLGHGGRE
jgi:pterin-4a-carbinolamine dehydratase